MASKISVAESYRSFMKPFADDRFASNINGPEDYNRMLTKFAESVTDQAKMSDIKIKLAKKVFEETSFYTTIAVDTKEYKDYKKPQIVWDMGKYGWNIYIRTEGDESTDKRLLNLDTEAKMFFSEYVDHLVLKCMNTFVGSKGNREMIRTGNVKDSE